MLGDDGKNIYLYIYKCMHIYKCMNLFLSGSQRFTQLMLVDRESEKNKWIDALHELHRIIRRNKLPCRNVSPTAKQIYY